MSDAAGLDDAAVVDGLSEYILRNIGLQQYRAALRLNSAAIADRCLQTGRVIQHLAVHGEADQAIAVKIYGRRIAGGEIDLAVIGDNPAVIDHAAAKQVDGAAIGGSQKAVIDDNAVGPAGQRAEIPVAVHEIGIVNVKCGGKQRADVH